MATTPSDRTSTRIGALREALVEVADPESAPAMAAYLKDHFAVFGIKSAPRRAAQKPLLAELAEADGDEVLDFARACWRQPEREFQYVAADTLRKHEASLGADGQTDEHLAALAELVTTKSWWDTVDSLAAHTVGPLVARNPELEMEMDRWIRSENMWLARTAILHQLAYKERTDADRLFAYADLRGADTEFFIRKALGWALRQYARIDAGAVRDYVLANEDTLSGLTKREALKHIER